MKYKVKVLTDEEMTGKEDEKILILNSEELEHLKSEIEGYNMNICEYETIDKEIINDLEIRRILYIKKMKGGLKNGLD